MTDVGEERLLRPDLFNHFECLRKIEVRDVLLALKGVKHENLCALQAFDGSRRDVIRIGDVTEVADAKSEDGQVQMHDRQREKRNSVHGKFIAVDTVKVQSWDTGVMFCHERVRVFHL